MLAAQFRAGRRLQHQIRPHPVAQKRAGLIARVGGDVHGLAQHIADLAHAALAVKTQTGNVQHVILVVHQNLPVIVVQIQQPAVLLAHLYCERV